MKHNKMLKYAFIVKVSVLTPGVMYNVLVSASAPWVKSDTAYRRDLPGASSPSGLVRHLATPADLW